MSNGVDALVDPMKLAALQPARDPAALNPGFEKLAPAHGPMLPSGKGSND
jgi:hypothetical protein